MILINMRYGRVEKDGKEIQIARAWSDVAFRTLLSLAGNDRMDYKAISYFTYGYLETRHKIITNVNRVKKKLGANIEAMPGRGYLLKEDVYIE